MNQGVKKRKRDDSEHVDGEPSRRSRHQYDANQQHDAEQLCQSEDVLDLSGKMISSFTELKDICWKHRNVQKILLRDIFYRKPFNIYAYSNSDSDSDSEVRGYEDMYHYYEYDYFIDDRDPYYEPSERQSESEFEFYSYCDSDDDRADGGFYDDLYKTKVCHTVQDSSDPTGKFRELTLLEELKQICPGVRSIDITGCGYSSRCFILEGFYPINITNCHVIGAKLSEKLGIEIIDSIQENPVLRDFLTPLELLSKPVQVKSTAKQIEELVRKGSPADSSINGWTLLHSACALGDVELVEFLLQRVGPKGGNTCSGRLWEFSKGGRTFSPNGVSTVDIIGFPPPCIVALACYHHQLFDIFKTDIICELLSALQHLGNMANILLIDRIKFSSSEATEGDIDCFHYSFSTKAMRTPHFSLKEVIQWLCDILCQQQQQRQALLEALFLGATTTHYEDEQTIEESVKFLLNLGCSVPENFNIMETLVSVPLLTPLVVKHGCEIQGNQTDGLGKTRLHYTVKKVDKKVELDKMKHVCQLLLDCGADINAKDGEDEVPVVTCMRTGITSSQLLKTANLCTWLIEKGADGKALIHWREDSEDSLLHCALKRIGKVGSIDALKEICKLLLDLGADINAKNDCTGETPIVSCLRGGLEDWNNISDTPYSEGEQEILKKEMTNRQASEELQSCSTVVNMCNWLIDRGADKTAVKKHTCGAGRSFFHYVVSKIDETEPLDAIKDACKLLINCGADINRKNNSMHVETPLYECFRAGFSSCLNKERSTEETTNCDRMEPNEQPQSKFPCNTLNMCSWLIDHGANPLSLKAKLKIKRNKSEWTLMHLILALVERFTEGKYIHLIKELCLFLLKHGADINAKDIEGVTPLMCFIRSGLQISPTLDTKYTELANWNISSNEEEMPDEGQQSQPQVNSFVVNTCKWLIESGASVNVEMLADQKYDQGNMPLHCALEAVHEADSSDTIKEVCKLLLEHGASINARNRKGETPLLRCIRYSFCRWNRGSHVESPAREGTSKSGCVEMTDDGSVSAQAELAMGQTPSCSNTVNMCNWLIELGADLNSAMLNQVKYQNRNTLLHHALLNVSDRESCDKVKEVCKLLLDHGADVNARNSVGETPIASCIRADLINDANWQIERAEERTTNQGKKAVEEVEPHHYPSTVQMCSWLIESGADVNMRLGYSQTVYHGIVTTLLHLFSYLMDQEESFAACTYENLVTFLCGITNASVSVNSRDDNGNSPLHFFVKHAVSKRRRQFIYCSLEAEENIGLINAEYLKLFNCLLSHGSKVNAVNDDQRSPLHLASGFHTCTATALLDAGASPNLKDKDGSTPLLTWVSAGINSSKAEWELMLKRGMDPFVANEACETVFSALLSMNKPHQTKLFLEAVKAVDPMSLNKLDGSGDSMLHILGRHKIDSVQEIFVLLLKLGADPNKLNSSNRETPLHILCRRIVSCLTEEENEEKKVAKEGKPTEEIILDSGFDWAISALKKYGAEPHISGSSGQTCIEFAENHELTKLKALLEKPTDQIVIPPLLPWIQQSDKHKSLLGQVARHQKSKQIELFQYNTQPIGNGAFGVVYAGIHEKDGREVAVKKISLPIQCFDHPGKEREIKNLLQLKDCEHIIKYYNYCLTEDSLYIIFELMDGDLEELICPEKEIVKLCRNVMDGLSYLHSRKVLHRDIKPGNVLYKTHPTLCLKLADFGLSKEDSAMAASVTVMHSKVGTRCWMAAEVHKTVEYSEESDVFSAGLVLHYILADKKHAFEPGDTGKTFAEIQHKIEGNILKGKSNLSESLSPEAQNLLEWMLKHNKIERPKTAACVKHPYFWSKKKKKDFLCAVANQPEFQVPRRIAASRGLSSMEQDLEAALGSEFVSNPWDGEISVIYLEMTCTPRSSRYLTTSAVDLLRFVRNSYAHVSSEARPTAFQKELLEKYVFFDKFPTLLITVYQAVKLYKWDAREEIKNVIKPKL